MKNMRLKVKKAVVITLLTNIIQIVAILVLLLYLFLSPSSVFVELRTGSQLFFIFIVIISIIAIVFSGRDIYYILRVNMQNNMMKETLKSVEMLNNTLRAQRHDFLNHLQVVYGLIEMDEYEEARNYINKTYKDIQSVSQVLKTASPAINALLQAKRMTAEQNMITMEVTVTSRFEDLPIPSWELCRVLGNLIDNAISSLCEKPDNRLLQMELTENFSSYIVSVKDNGAKISEKIKGKIFEPGFTTKKDFGQGMGLAITKNIIQKYSGRIEVSSDDRYTVFTVHIPKAHNKRNTMAKNY